MWVQWLFKTHVHYFCDYGQRAQTCWLIYFFFKFSKVHIERDMLIFIYHEGILYNSPYFLREYLYILGGVWDDSEETYILFDIFISRQLLVWCVTAFFIDLTKMGWNNNSRCSMFTYHDSVDLHMELELCGLFWGGGVVQEMVYWNSPGYPRTQFLEQVGLKLTEICLPLFPKWED